MKHSMKYPCDLPFELSLEQQVAKWKNCPYCDHARPPDWRKKRCAECHEPFEPLKAEFFEKANKNRGLIRVALSLYRKDLYALWQSSEYWREEFKEWVLIPLALAARKHKPDQTKFSTYGVKSIRNHLNRAYPFGTVGIGEDEKSNLGIIPAREQSTREPDEPEEYEYESSLFN